MHSVSIQNEGIWSGYLDFKGDWLAEREVVKKEAGDTEMGRITKKKTLLKCQSGP